MNLLRWILPTLCLSSFGIILSCQSRVNSPTQSVDDTLAKILREKKLRVGYITYPPTAFRDPSTGQMRGHFVDTLREITKQLDPSIEIQFEETTWTDFMAALNAGRIDLSISGTFTSVPRAKNVAFTRPLVYLGRSAIIRKGDTRFSPDKGPLQFDRADLKIGVVDGEGSHEFAKTYFTHLSKLVVFSGTDLQQCLAAVSAGQVDVGMSDAMETERYAKVHPEVTDLFAANPYDITPVGWAVRPSDMIWKNFLDTALGSLESQGRLAAFEKAYDYRWLQPSIEYRRR
jgi:ABC-type amino acid transport substrate-binding protein